MTGVKDGGKRKNSHAPSECGAGCEKNASGRFWADSTEYIAIGPEPPPGEPSPPGYGGVCWLRCTEVEVTFCRPVTDKPDDPDAPAPWPPPLKPPKICGPVYRDIVSFVVAEAGADNEMLCNFSLFSPFQRIQQAVEIAAEPGDTWVHPDTGNGTRQYLAATHFITNNFRPQDCLLEGIPWLSMDRNYIVGRAPSELVERRYEGKIIAWNRHGQAEQEIIIVVKPANQAEPEQK